MLIGVSDRMLTAGDIQFEPETRKIWPLTSSIAVLLAGDAPLNMEVIQWVLLDVRNHITAQPNVWVPVNYVAESYQRRWREIVARQREHRILAPLGLTTQTWLTEQQRLAPTLVKDVATELLSFRPEPTEALIVGTDTGGQHIYMARNGDLTCQDGVGFAAIGSGSWHADSAFMFARHGPTGTQPPALFLTYAAKKRAEVAPGVGTDTDMFTIGAVGTFGWVPPQMLTRLDGMYQAMRQAEDKAFKNARRRVNAYVEQLTKAAAKQQQPPTAATPGPTAPADAPPAEPAADPTAGPGGPGAPEKG